MIKTHKLQYVTLLILIAVLQFFTSSIIDSNPLGIAINVTLFLLNSMILWFFFLSLKRNDIYTQAVLDSLDEMILICNEKGEIQYSNHLMQNILSRPVYKFPNIFSKEWEDYLWLETMSGGRMPIEKRPFVRALKGESVMNEEVRLRFCDFSSDQILLVTGKALSNALGKTVGAMLIMKNITVLKEEEQHRIRLAKILEATSDFVGTAGKDGKTVYVNKAGLKMVGRDSFTDLKISELHPSSVDEIIWQEAIPTAVSNGIWQGETALLHRSGETIPVSQVILSHKLDNGEVEFLSTIARDISKIKEAEEKILHMARHDDLTGLLNRRGFNELANDYLTYSGKEQPSAAVFYFDLDGFKDVNDFYGHQAGDALLQQVGERAATIINENDLFSRQGGDEFALLLMDLNLGEIKHKAKELQNLFLTPLVVEGQEVNIAISVGISKYPADGETIDNLIKKADHAMYISKRSGKNFVSFFHESYL